MTPFRRFYWGFWPEKKDRKKSDYLLTYLSAWVMVLSRWLRLAQPQQETDDDNERDQDGV